MAIKKIKLEKSQQLDFSEALYGATCPKCGEGIGWEAYFDADGTNYGASCCGLSFYMTPATVNVTYSEEDE